MSAQQRRSAIFLDRDGVVNASPATRFVTSWRRFRFLPDVLDAFRTLNDHGRIVIIVSNQSGVGRGVLSTAHLKDITQRMLQSIRRAGGQVHAVYYCPHHPQEGCVCRKPHTGMLRQAARRFSIDLKRSFVIGDSETDILMGHSAGCMTVLVLSGKVSKEQARRLSIVPDRTVKGLSEAVQWILRQKIAST
jgi:histidinol-phosphate phosphatase family protein